MKITLKSIVKYDKRLPFIIDGKSPIDSRRIFMKYDVMHNIST